MYKFVLDSMKIFTNDKKMDPKINSIPQDYQHNRIEFCNS